MAESDRAEQIRKMIMADPNVAKIAENLGMSYGVFVELVMKYALNPGVQPLLNVMSDAELRAAGQEPPTKEKILASLKHHVEVRTITSRSKFADPNSQRERVQNAIPAPPAATAKPDEVRNDLKEELDRELSSGKNKKL
jgi:hypothetical protein